MESLFNRLFPGPIQVRGAEHGGYTLVPTSSSSRSHDVDALAKGGGADSSIYAIAIVSSSTRGQGRSGGGGSPQSQDLKGGGSFDVFEEETEPQVPYFLNPWILPNAAITLSFVDVGVAMYFLQAPVSYYLIHTLNINARQYAAYSTLINVPWSLKFIFGMISDGIPILGYRRKSWLAIGWIIYAVGNYYLAYLEEPGITTTTVMMFVMTCAYLLSDVCTDTMCVERARFETDANRGTLQTVGYTNRAFGSIVGAILGAILFNKTEWGWGLTISQLFVISALIPLTGVLPTIWHVEELASSRPAPNFVTQLGGIWHTLQLKAVWKPMIFIFTYYVFQVPNAAWTNFLVAGLGFTDFEIGMITVSSTIFLWLGMIIFKTFFFQTSWRKIFIYTTGIGVCFSIMQLLLTLRLNSRIGIPDLIFALGDTSVAYLMFAIQSMPASIMFIMLCPEGSEGITYALLTTIGNLAWNISWDIGSTLTAIWDVSNETLAAGDFSGITKLTILTSLLQLSPIILVRLLPDSKEEQAALRDAGEKSWWGGFWLSIVVVLSLIITFGINIYYVIIG